MRKNRFWLSLSFAFVLLLTLVGTGFGLFYVGDTDPVSVDNIGTRVDDIEENYILKDAGVGQESYYDVYFFCTPYAAQVDPSRLIELAPGTGGNGYDSAVRFYWWNGGTAAQESQASQSNYGQNGWRKIRVYRSISIEQFNNIGTPVAGTDIYVGPGKPASEKWDCDHGSTAWPLDFSGWTANRAAASATINFNNTASYNQGNFDYVDAFSPLSQIDSGTEDGSKKDDNVIYLYPIFTTGKNYNRSGDLNNDSHQQPAIRLSFSNPTGYQGEGHYFFAQDGEDNNSVYSYKNLTINEGELNKYSIEVTPMEWTTTGHRSWFPPWEWTYEYGIGWSNSWSSTGATPIANLPGTYDITIYLFNQAYDQNSDNLDTYAINSFDSAISKTEQGVVVNELVLTNINLSPSSRERMTAAGCNVIVNQSTNNPSVWNGNTQSTSQVKGDSAFLCYIQVERVYEFHLLGGPYGTFNYDETQYFYEGEIGVTDTDAKTRTFGLNNVYFDASERTFTDTYVGVGDENRIGTFRNNVFTIDFMNTVWANNIQAFTADELAEINSYATNTYHEEKPNYVSIDENGILQKAVAKINSTDTDYDYELSNVSNPEAVRTLLKITETGFYNFRIQVKFKSTASTTDLESYVESIKIAVSPVKSDYFVKIYRNDSFDRLYSDDSGKNGFIDHNGALSGGNELLYVANFNEFGSPLSEMDFRSPDSPGTSVSYESILKTYRTIRDHVTKNAVDPNMILEKNYVFYVSN